MPYKSLLLTGLFCFIFVSCQKGGKANPAPSSESYTVYRRNALIFSMIGYDSAELGTIVIRKFQPDGTFSRVVDSSVLLHNNGKATWRYSDAQPPFDSLSNNSLVLVSCTDTAYTAYDYEVEIASNQKIYKISNVTFRGADSVMQMSCCPVEITTRDASYLLDGQNIADSSFSFSGTCVWLKK